MCVVVVEVEGKKIVKKNHLVEGKWDVVEVVVIRPLKKEELGISRGRVN